MCSNSPEFQYSCGRNSQIWRVSLNAMRATSSQRVAHLSRHKTAPPDYLEHRPQFTHSCGRSSQIWATSKAAVSCRPRPHTAGLSRPKQTHTDYQPSRQVHLANIVANDLGEQQSNIDGRVKSNHLNAQRVKVTHCSNLP